MNEGIRKGYEEKRATIIGLLEQKWMKSENKIKRNTILNLNHRGRHFGRSRTEILIDLVRDHLMIETGYIIKSLKAEEAVWINMWFFKLYW